jgi:hypothetical protein
MDGQLRPGEMVRTSSLPPLIKVQSLADYDPIDACAWAARCGLYIIPQNLVQRPRWLRPHQWGRTLWKYGPQ